MKELLPVTNLNNQQHGLDIVFNRDEAIAFVDAYGWESFFETVSKMFPERELYNCSQDWYKSRRYTCKLKGVYGDVLIGWYGAHIM
jgi:hypothetical protein